MIAQNQTRNWYFGSNAGLNFAGGSPTVATGGALTNSLGCAAISGTNGNLLFYTDGVTVYTGSNTVMANGNNLHGTNSFQSCVIVKQPNSSNLYYIFTVGGLNTGNGLKYSIVDMNLAAGAGSVTSKNISIDANCRDKITVGKHCNGNDLWIVSTPTIQSGFVSVLVNNSGIGSTVYSTISGSSNGGIGQLKISPNSRKIAFTTNNYSPGPLAYVNSKVIIYDFDNSNGNINLQNPTTLYLLNNTMAGNPRTFNCEFSPNSNYLYWSSYLAPNSSIGGSVIHKFHLCSQSLGSTEVYNTDSNVQDTVTKGSFQIGSNGNIYVASPGKTTLGMINNPNNLNGSATYTSVGISLGTPTCQWGLPNFPGFFFEQKPNPNFSYTVNGSCQDVLFSTPPICSASGYSITGYQWNFGDIASGTNNTSFLAAPSHSFTNTGNYTVSLIRYFQCNTNDTITQIVSIVQPSLNVIMAGGCAMGNATVQVVNGVGPYTYSWSAGSQTNAVFSNSISGIYTVNVIDQGAGYCSRTSTFNLLVPSGGASVSISPSVLCFGATNASVSSSVFGGSGSYSYSWSCNCPNTSSVNNLGVGVYSLVVHDNGQNCNFNTTFAVNSANPLGLQTNVLNNMVCEGGAIHLNASASGGIGPYTYTWLPTNANNNTISPTLPAGNYTYSVNITDALNCSISNTVSFSVAANPTISVLPQVSVCVNSSTVISASGVNTFTWQPGGQHTSSIQVSANSNMVYTVSGSNQNNCVNSQTMLLVALPAPVTLVQNNSPICAGQIAYFNTGLNQVYSWQGPNNFTANVPNPQISNTPLQNAGTYTLHVVDMNGCKDSTMINLVVYPLPPVWINSNTTITCIGQMVNLTALGANTYTWWNNANTVNLSISPTGNTVVTVVGTNTANNCSATASLAIVVKECNASGVEEMSVAESKFIIFPNPSNGEFTVRSDESAAYELMTVIGQVIAKGALNKGDNKLHFGEINKGTYFFRHITPVHVKTGILVFE